MGQEKPIALTAGGTIEYQVARAEAAEARAELAEAAAAVNLAQLQAASATIDYLRKYASLQAAKEVKDRALEAAKKALPEKSKVK